MIQQCCVYLLSCQFEESSSCAQVKCPSSCAQVDILEIMLRDSLDLLDQLFIVEVSNNMEVNDFAHKMIMALPMPNVSEWQWHVTNLSSLLPKAEKTHKGKPKPLMWSKIKQDERFRWDSNLFSCDYEE